MIEVLTDPEQLSSRAADLFEQLSHAAIQRQNRFVVCLSGGSTPRLLYSKLPERRIFWDKTHLFWGDERCVPPQSPQSNFRMVKETLLNRISIPEKHVHRMQGEMDPEEAARLYEKELKALFGVPDLPRFDLIYLGLGEDGHTASLFPGSRAVTEKQRWVVPNEAPQQLYSRRLTLTFPVLNAAENIQFLITGEDKALILKQVLEVKDATLPASLIQPASGNLLFLVDSGAAKELTAV